LLLVVQLYNFGCRVVIIQINNLEGINGGIVFG
jgi:hypothetical protein